MSYRFATGKRYELVRDFLERAGARRRFVIETLAEHGCFADVVKEACTIVDFATLALLIFERVDIPAQCVAEGSLTLEESHNALASIMRVMQKPHNLSDYAVGSVVMSDYFDEADARAALLYADHMLKLISERLLPRLVEAQAALDAEEELPQLEPPPGLLIQPSDLPRVDDDEGDLDGEEGAVAG